MRPVAEVINLAMQKISIEGPTIPVVFNYSAKTEKRSGYVKSLLFSQICHTVLWKKSIEYMLKKGVDHFIELGPGQTMTQIIKRISPKSKFTTINTYAAMKEFVDQQ